MLPTFPKAQKILDDMYYKRVLDAKAKVMPHFLHPPVHQIQEGKCTNYQREDRQIRPLNIKKHSVEVRHEIKDGHGMTLDALNSRAEELGRAFGAEMFKTVTGAVEEAVAETGNELKIKAGNLTKEDVFRFLEMGDKNFDEEGKPTGFLLCTPAFGEELKQRQSEWAKDPEFLAKVQEITRRKKADFDEREACRRLVD